MITKNALKYVYKKATSQSSEEIYKKLKDIDDKYNKIVQKYECTITFKCMKNVSFVSKLSAQSSFGKSIIVSPEWAYTLMSSNNDNVNNAFLITIGHEITHKENDIHFINGLSSFIFSCWINELHADFGAAEKMVNNNRQLLLESCKYKKERVLLWRQSSKDKYSKFADLLFNKIPQDHPSWQQRIDYITNYNFNEELIRKIAKDTKCSNEKRIQKVINQFDPIILK